ncbi:D-serine/D-alanine/glycine transporter [Raoultella terrigena]|uniref:D-serine/D-alanine/glycine transporter n=1 Tax=Raoultella terrigena TaxID=577 RepID=A0A3P8KYI7_RAOTE|nr:D-serine/D-alanine/glycine transporter [Raoultella terrigena]
MPWPRGRAWSPDASPFVTLFAKAGLPAAAAVVNFVALTSAMSSANSGVYSSTRMLYGLSVEKHAHGQFRILSRHTRIPVRSLLFSCFLHAQRHAAAVPRAERDDPVHHRLDAGGHHGGLSAGE